MDLPGCDLVGHVLQLGQGLITELGDRVAQAIAQSGDGALAHADRVTLEEDRHELGEGVRGDWALAAELRRDHIAELIERGRLGLEARDLALGCADPLAAAAGVAVAQHPPS